MRFFNYIFLWEYNIAYRSLKQGLVQGLLVDKKKLNSFDSDTILPSPQIDVFLGTHQALPYEFVFLQKNGILYLYTSILFDPFFGVEFAEAI